MNCQIFETVVNDLAREQMMEASAREEALAHSGDCEACALRLSFERRLTFGLRALVMEMESESASARVEQQLLEAFRRHTSLVPQTRPAHRNRYWLLAAAAVLVIAFGIVGMKWGYDERSQTAIDSTHDTAAPAPSKSPIATNEHRIQEPTPKPTQAVYRPRRKQSVPSSRKRFSGASETTIAKGQSGLTNTPEERNSEESEVTTQFLPLSYTSPINLQDGGQLVRVEMPRSAMVSLGLPVNMERYGEKVKADVLISADGLARAIRFVH